MEDRPQDRPSWANMTEMQRAAALDHAEWEKRAGIFTETREEREMRRRLEKAREEWERTDTEPGVDYNMLCVYKAGEWIDIAKRSPAQIDLFGDLWRQGELAIMFADTGVGKSILAVQIAEALARGIPIEPLAMPSEPRRVLYLDFELSFTQFSERYSRTSADGTSLEGEYKFHENFLRGEIEWRQSDLFGRAHQSRLLLVHDRAWVENCADFAPWRCPKHLEHHAFDQSPPMCAAS